jgi:hypothetical protein
LSCGDALDLGSFGHGFITGRMQLPIGGAKR